MICGNFKKAVLVGGALMTAHPAYCGGGMSKAVGAVVVGVATGGVGLAVGAPAMAAITAGTAAAVGTAARGNTRAGVRINGNGQRTLQVNVRTDNGRDIVNLGANSRDLHPANGSNITNSGGNPIVNMVLHRSPAESARIAKEKFSNWHKDTVYDTLIANGHEYCRAKSSTEEFLTLGVSNGWSKKDRELIGTQRFENQPWNLTFETTPYQWYFDIVTIGGKRYNHAYSDALSDFLVPEGERHTICAPDSFIEQYRLEQENEKKQKSIYASLPEKKAAAKKAEDHSTEFAKAFFSDSQSSIYGSAYYAWQCQVNREREAQNLDMARKLAQGAMEYYQAAIGVAESVNLGALMDTAIAFVVPGGIENIQNFASGTISSGTFLSNIAKDIGQDAVFSVATLGFGGFAHRITKTSLRTAIAAVEKAGKAKMKTVAATRVSRVFGHGTYWDFTLFNRSLKNTKWGKEADKYSKRTRSDVRFDDKGYAYKFDPAHKTDKVHLHKYKNMGGDKFKLIEEIDPETGDFIDFVKNGRPEQW